MERIIGKVEEMESKIVQLTVRNLVIFALLFCFLTFSACSNNEDKKVKSNSNENDRIIKEFHHAAISGNLLKVKNFLKKNPGLINAKDENGDTPLSLAIELGTDKDVPIYLIKNGADVDFRDEDGSNLLHFVKDRELAELLVNKGVDLNAEEEGGTTPLHIAASFGRTEVALFLIENEAKVNAVSKYGTPLRGSVNCSRFEISRALIKKGADPNIKDYCGMTPLHLASMLGRFREVRLLVSNGADVNIKDNDGKTPLSYTKFGILRNRGKIAKFLRKHGAK
ncbi:MAG: ankyrin repeat domain-containing protein [Candidatus Eremiobacteraeota bacterium]|nr:ankyrin repeat domain-containing protein [Candidatus Eremiobacteraeota bacterium]